MAAVRTHRLHTLAGASTTFLQWRLPSCTLKNSLAAVVWHLAKTQQTGGYGLHELTVCPQMGSATKSCFRI
eukprot:233872-Chlamydomonas_euryale.AAC.2